MAFKKTGTTFNEAANEWMEHYECDHEWEVANLPKCNPGSTVNVLATGKEYSVGNNGLWGGGGGAKSWNDLTDKPFGEETGVVEVLAECQPTYDSGIFLIPNPATIILGEHYIVNWNGVEYSATAHSPDQFGGVATNLPVVVNDGANIETKEGFVFQLQLGTEEMGGAYGVVLPYDGTTELILSITTEGTVITPIEGKYLPKGTPWIEEGGMVEVLPEYTITEDDMDAGMGGTPALGLVKGNTYVVKWQGVEYTCVAWEVTLEGMPTVGLGDIYTASQGELGTAATGEPFALMEYPPEIAASVGLAVEVVRFGEMSFPIVFSIYGEGETIHKIDPRCLPNGVGESPVVVVSVKSMDESTGAITMSHTADEIVNAIYSNKAVFMLVEGYFIATCRNMQDGETGRILSTEFASILNPELVVKVDANGVLVIDG